MFPRFVTRNGNVKRRKGLDELRKLRNDGGLGHQDFGSVVLSIPELDFAVLQRRYPDLISRDNETNKRAWLKFLASPESAPYRVRDTDGKGKQRQSSVIVP